MGQHVPTSHAALGNLTPCQFYDRSVAAAPVAKTCAANEAMAREEGLRDPIKEREAAGRFWLGKARGLRTDGDHHAGMLAMEQLAEIWPEGRQEALDCYGLPGIW